MAGEWWKSLPIVAVPKAILSMMSWRLIDSFSALRTSTLSKGAWSTNIGMVIAEAEGTLSISIFGSRCRSASVFRSSCGDRVHVAGDQRGLAGVRVIEDDDLDLVEIGALQVPAVVAHQPVAHAELGLGQLVGAAAVAGLPVDRAVLVGRADRQVVIGHQPREIGIARPELEGHRMVAVVDDILHVLQKGRRRRGRALAAVVVHRRDHVIGRHLGAAVEGGVRVELERPFPGVRCRRPFRRHVGPVGAVGLDQGQVAAEGMRELDHREGDVGAGVVVVGRVAVMGAQSEDAAPAGCGRRRFGPEPGGRRYGNPGRDGIAHEIAARDAALAGLFGQQIHGIRSHFRSLCHVIPLL